MRKDKTSELIKQIASDNEFRKDPKEFISTHKNLLEKETFEEEQNPINAINNSVIDAFIKELERCKEAILWFFDEHEYTD